MVADLAETSGTSPPSGTTAQFEDFLWRELVFLHGRVCCFSADHGQNDPISTERSFVSLEIPAPSPPAVHDSRIDAAVARHFDRINPNRPPRIITTFEDVDAEITDRDTKTRIEDQTETCTDSPMAFGTAAGRRPYSRRPLRGRVPSDDGDGSPSRTVSGAFMRSTSGTSVGTQGDFALEECDEQSDEPMYTLHPIWKEEILAASTRGILSPVRQTSFQICDTKSTFSSSFFPSSQGILEDNLTQLEMMCNNCVLNKFVAHPNSRQRLFWDLTGMVFVAYDIITIPLMVFDLDETLPMTVLSWALLLFWTIDLPLSFFVGHHEAGVLVTNVLKIAKRYVLSWFSLDIFLLTAEWLLTLTSNDDEEADRLNSIGLARMGKTVRVVRLLRLFRLLRLMKLPKYFVQLEEHIQSEFSVVIIGISKLTACILVINHFIACLWYAVGTTFKSAPEETSWVSGVDWGNRSVWYRYGTSLHWSLTQFTPASMEVFPVNTRERLFAIVVLIFALITFSSFVSSITNAMTRLRNMNSEYAKQLLKFQRYIRYHKISTPLAVRMRRHLEHRLLRADRHIVEKDVELVTLLSEPLRMEMHFEVFAPYLEMHPFFKDVFEDSLQTMRKVCHTCVTEILLSYGDLLFASGDSCGRMFIIKSGSLEYTSEESTHSDPEDVNRGEWLSEASLWTEWTHVGAAVCPSRCNLMALDVELFHNVIKGSRLVKARAARFGEYVVRHLNAMDKLDISDLRDVGMDYAEALGYMKDLPMRMNSNRSISPTASSRCTTAPCSQDVLSPRVPNGSSARFNL
eukprot:TRINITY_DN40073_c0_g1_i2.p1 TRINITY_DN40073_c0_g1~~TRINITY_DN40073_c0_g1_i2.p1  ORF type:complete len:798 (+),score=127.37 TRINITY_DN40073_c0_g1_i2:244-2637(+)